MRIFLGLLLIIFLSAVSARADWRHSVSTLRIGVVAGPSPVAVQVRLEPFRRHLQLFLNMPVEVVPAPDYSTLVKAHAARKVHYAFYTASAYATAWRLCKCVEPLVAPRGEDGTKSYFSVLVVDSKSGIGSPGGLGGKTVAFSFPGSIAGYRFPMAELRRAGFDPKAEFGKVMHAESSKGALKALLDGKADAAMIWSSLNGVEAEGFSRGTLHQMTLNDGLDPSRLRIVWRSRPIPHGPHAILSSLPDPLKRLLFDLLVSIDYDDPDAYDAVDRIHGGGFAAATHEEYHPLLDMLSARWDEADSGGEPSESTE